MGFTIAGIGSLVAVAMELMDRWPIGLCWATALVCSAVGFGTAYGAYRGSIARNAVADARSLKRVSIACLLCFPVSMIVLVAIGLR